MNTNKLQALELLRNGDLAAAANAATAVLAADPNEPEMWQVVGIYELTNNPNSAAQAFKSALLLDASLPHAWKNLAKCYAHEDDIVSASQCIEKALELGATDAKILEQALKLISRAAATLPSLAAKMSVFTDLALRRAIQENPRHADFHIMRAVLQETAGDLDMASSSWLLALGASDQKASLLLQYGEFLFRVGRKEQAARVFLEATNYEDEASNAWFSYGKCLDMANNFIEAEQAYAQALDINPNCYQAMLLFANIKALRKQFDEASVLIDRALELWRARGATDEEMLSHRVTARYYNGMIHRWDHDPTLEEDVSAQFVQGQHGLANVSPFCLMTIIDSPEMQLNAALARDCYPGLRREALDFEKDQDRKIRIGWFGADFHDHATMFLMRDLFRIYDKTKFEFTIFSYGKPPRNESACREELIKHVDTFHDVYGKDDDEIVNLARSAKLDIAVDLKVFTAGGRLSIFARGLAPIQIQYLGYPGTSGKDYFDYMVADPTVVPAAERSHYSEAIMFMPGSYQPNDPERLVAPELSTRGDWGLPDDAFVFVGFHQPYKINAEVFDIWLELLAKVDDSVLWLWSYAEGEAGMASRETLIQYAEAKGIDGKRLVFSKYVEQQRHMERLRHGDLFLDCFNVNGHTTISDALFVGLPAVTKPGRQFASRVGASLVTAAGIPDLVAQSSQHYTSLALRYATDLEFRKDIDRKLSEGLKAPGGLYDSAAYTRNLESLFGQAYARARRGETPEDLFL